MKIFIYLKKYLLGIIVLPIILLGLFVFITINYKSNLHIVSPDKVYRSAQPDSKFIKYLWQNHGIRCILNLRDENNTSWYKEEEDTTKSLGIKLINFPISVSKGLSEKEIKELVILLKEAPKPLLIHCKSGADRTGLASALYLHFLSEDQKDNAGGQLSIFYGHIPFFKARKMDQDFEISKKINPDDIFKTDKQDNKKS
ncbi:MAG: hypothetical protein C4617_04940 [Candidatus Liberibacter europaeus]|uniref:DSP-PTPase phosphatase fused to NAD+ Kinase domain-containing protein n=1 Tax=Candidatus Liberibacter europaeus TaxID=744859 RepID=A0A2T4VWS2_9HYPH|nr:hypothetical protein [Candidatus Liberibacter europaeus]PTL86218.1 MAG: hypothetical protein C4617_04940 [Candidatus Liberibacter europaeus]